MKQSTPALDKQAAKYEVTFTTPTSAFLFLGRKSNVRSTQPGVPALGTYAEDSVMQRARCGRPFWQEHSF
jgi:hypothetical protein